MLDRIIVNYHRLKPVAWNATESRLKPADAKFLPHSWIALDNPKVYLQTMNVMEMVGEIAFVANHVIPKPSLPQLDPANYTMRPFVVQRKVPLY
jgi:hypothetical protein